MSRLRKLPSKHTCQNVIGASDLHMVGTGYDIVCKRPAVICCNACKQYFCEECWSDHLEMTVVGVSNVPIASRII